MRNKQIKTLEISLIDALHDKNASDKLLATYEYVLRHFADEDYLHGTDHVKIIRRIYTDKDYKKKTMTSLLSDLHIDNKALLSYRKLYVSLFAKRYLGLNVKSETDNALLYVTLKKEAEKRVLLKTDSAKS